MVTILTRNPEGFVAELNDPVEVPWDRHCGQDRPLVGGLRVNVAGVIALTPTEIGINIQFTTEYFIILLSQKASIHVFAICINRKLLFL